MNALNPTPASNMLAHYFVEIERLLARVERAANPYELFAVGPAASPQEVRLAHQWMITMLSPDRCGITEALPDEFSTRIRRATEKSHAALAAVMGKIAVFGDSNPSDRVGTPGDVQPLRSDTPVDAGKPATAFQSTSFDPTVEAWNRAMNDERRRVQRVELSIPARVTGYDPQACKWHEMTQTVNVSRLGVAIKLRTVVRHGLVIHLSMPLPVRLRGHGHGDSTYNVYAIVRQIEPSRLGYRTIRLEFLGKEPPQGYFIKPWAIFRSKNRAGVNRRREARENRSEPMTIEYLDESQRCIGKTTATTLDLSRSGARILLRSTPPEFEFIRITSLNHPFRSLAIARDRYVGADGFECISLSFVENKWPF